MISAVSATAIAALSPSNPDLKSITGITFLVSLILPPTTDGPVGSDRRSSTIVVTALGSISVGSGLTDISSILAAVDNTIKMYYNLN